VLCCVVLCMRCVVLCCSGPVLRIPQQQQPNQLLHGGLVSRGLWKTNSRQNPLFKGCQLKSSIVLMRDLMAAFPHIIVWTDRESSVALCLRAVFLKGSQLKNHLLDASNFEVVCIQLWFDSPLSFSTSLHGLPKKG